MAKRRVELGATGRQVRDNVRDRAILSMRRDGESRRERDEPLTLAALSERTRELGRVLSASALSEIQTGARRVDVDDLMVLAAAMDVSPHMLLLPHLRPAMSAVDASGLGTAPALGLWNWVRDGLPVESAKTDSLPTGDEDWRTGSTLDPHVPWTLGQHRIASGRETEQLAYVARVTLDRLKEVGILPGDVTVSAMTEALEEVVLRLRAELGVHSELTGSPRDDHDSAMEQGAMPAPDLQDVS